MNITCEKCGARFFVDEAKLKKDLIHKKCPKCSNVITIRKPAESGKQGGFGMPIEELGGHFIEEPKPEEEIQVDKDEAPVELTAVVEEEAKKAPEAAPIEFDGRTLSEEDIGEVGKPKEEQVAEEKKEEKNWKVMSSQGKIFGPYSLDNLFYLIQEKRLDGLDRVSKAGGPWEKAFTVPELSTHFRRPAAQRAPQPPPPPPVVEEAVASKPPVQPAQEEKREVVEGQKELVAGQKEIVAGLNEVFEGVKRAIPKIDIALPKVKMPGVTLPKVDLSSLIPAVKYLGVIVIVIIAGYAGYKLVGVIAPRAKSMVKMVGKIDLMKEDLVSSYSRAIGPVDGTPEEHFQKGVKYFEMNTKEGFLMAEEELKKSLVLKPQYPQALATLAETFLRGRDLKEDSNHLAEATELAALSTTIDPKLADGYMVQAYLHDLQGEKEEATKKAMKALELRPNDIGSNYFLGSLMIKENREAEAVPYLEKVAKVKPEFVQTHIDLATIYAKLGNHRAALSQWRSLVSLDSSNGQYQCGLAESLVKNELKEEAIRPLGKCVEIISDNVTARIELVRLLLDVKKKPLEAQEHLETLLSRYSDRITPQQVNNYRGTLGRIYLETDRPDAAIKELATVVTQDPRNSEAHYYLGEAYYRGEKFQDAEKEFRTVIQLDPRSARSHVSLGNVLGKFGRLDLAIEEYKAALAIDPSSSEAHYILGSYYSQRGLTYESIEEFKSAIHYDPRHLKAHYGLGLAAFKVGDNELAIKELKRAKELNPRYEDVCYHLGDVYFASGKVKLAVKEFKEYLSRSPKGPYADEARGMIRQYGR